ncbi:MAG: hypothetical protein ABWZ42_07300 [Ilumatobacteraceae bacterium]
MSEPGSGQSVVVVEDDNRLFVRRVLERNEYVVHAFAGAAEALEFLRSSTCRVVVSDIAARAVRGRRGPSPSGDVRGGEV